MKCKTWVKRCPREVSGHSSRTHFGHSFHTRNALHLHSPRTSIALPQLSICTSRTHFRILFALLPHSARASTHSARTRFHLGHTPFTLRCVPADTLFRGTDAPRTLHAGAATLRQKCAVHANHDSDTRPIEVA